VPALGGQFANVFHVALGDGSVRALSKRIPEKSLRAAITANGGEVVDWQKVDGLTTAGSAIRTGMMTRLRQRNMALKEEATVLREILAELKLEVRDLRWAVESDRLMALDPEAAALQKENEQLEKTLRETREEARKLFAEIQRLKQQMQKKGKK
jgi:predicted RNase H-like nuclease (RuvC/YqgF family)